VSRRGWLGFAAGAAAAAAAVGTGVVVERRVVRSRRSASSGADELGGLHSTPVAVIADDGVRLHAEVDEVTPYAEDAAKTQPPKGIRRLRRSGPSEATLVFVHGYALNLDCWHFQREYFRGKHRMVFYDQRSHGRSGRSDNHHATIEQLGDDLKRVLDELVPAGPVVLLGHSMGGMTVMAFAERHPEMFADRVTGVALISTTAGGLDPSRLLMPMVPLSLGSGLTHRAIRLLGRGHRAIDAARRLGKDVAMVATDLFAFGDEVPAAYVEYVDAMLSSTPFEVVAEFFPSFSGLDKFHAVEVLGRVPTAIICGTADRMTSIGHSRKLHARIAGSTLLECERAGHMVIMERHAQVNAELDQLIAAAAATLEPR
jgi:pimeloyl-ACP methyl ester carboxylesterase